MLSNGFDDLREFEVGDTGPAAVTDGGVDVVRRRNDRLAAAAFVLHGPLDILLTAVGRRVCPGDPESNPVVLELGEGRWLAVKGIALAGGAVAWYIGRDMALLGLPLGLLAGVGAVLVLPNAIVIYGCLTADQSA